MTLTKIDGYEWLRIGLFSIWRCLEGSQAGCDYILICLKLEKKSTYSLTSPSDNSLYQAYVSLVN